MVSDDLLESLVVLVLLLLLLLVAAFTVLATGFLAGGLSSSESSEDEEEEEDEDLDRLGILFLDGCFVEALVFLTGVDVLTGWAGLFLPLEGARTGSLWIKTSWLLLSGLVRHLLQDPALPRHWLRSSLALL